MTTENNPGNSIDQQESSEIEKPKSSFCLLESEIKIATPRISENLAWMPALEAPVCDKEKQETTRNDD
jgi:hypothetical protein